MLSLEEQITQLTRERDEARASDAESLTLYRNCRDRLEASASALRDRVAVLESALAASEYLTDRYRRCHAGKPVRDLDEAEAAFTTARDALKESTHV